MAIVVYRGVPYDTDRRIKQDAAYVSVPECYRGVKHNSVIKIEEVQK